MEAVIQILTFLASNPHLSVPLAVLLLFWPVAKRAGTMVDEGFGRLVPHVFSTRVAVFTLLVHVAAVTVAAIICYAFTNVPPANFMPKRAEMYGVETERFMGYLTSVCFAIFSIIGVLAGVLSAQNGDPIVRLTRDMFGARMALFGLVGSIGVMIYSAWYDPFLVAPIPEFPSFVFAAAWWYTNVPLVCVLLMVGGYLVSQIVRFTWNIAAKLS